MRYIGYIEISVGFGGGLGPGIGGQIYPYLGYEITQYVFGAMCLVGVALGATMIPSELNETATDEEIAELELIEEENEPREKKQKLKITWCSLFAQKETMFALLCVFCGTYNLMFQSTWLSTFLISLDMGESAAGNIQMAQSIMYLVGCLILPYTCESGSRRLQFMISFFGFGVCCMLLGPS